MGWSSWPTSACGAVSPNDSSVVQRATSLLLPTCCRAAIDPNEVADRLSAAYLIAVNARTVSEVGAIASSAATGTRLPTLTVDTVIGFRSPEDRAAFATDLQSAVAALVARYHHDDGRPHRLTVSSYPRPEEPS